MSTAPEPTAPDEGLPATITLSEFWAQIEKHAEQEPKQSPASGPLAEYLKQFTLSQKPGSDAAV